MLHVELSRFRDKDTFWAIGELGLSSCKGQSVQTGCWTQPAISPVDIVGEGRCILMTLLGITEESKEVGA